jgi:catechol 2,3-dioxygenase-like lactoylglutathione lyase family enzyme
MGHSIQRLSTVSRSSIFFAALVGIACGQTLPPGASAPSAGHIHLIAKDPAGVRQFWVDVFGAKSNEGSTDSVLLGSTTIWIEKGEPAGGTDGSVIRDIGVRVKNLDGILNAAAGKGFQGRQTSRTAGQLWAPDAVQIELIGDPRIPADAAVDHIHLLVPDPSAARKWYAERFGNPIPGIRLDFISATTPGSPTKGRAVDRIGMEVGSLEAYSAPEKAIKFEGGPAMSPALKARSAFFTDPWGMRVELIERRK